MVALPLKHPPHTHTPLPFQEGRSLHLLTSKTKRLIKANGLNQAPVDLAWYINQLELQHWDFHMMTKVQQHFLEGEDTSESEKPMVH